MTATPPSQPPIWRPAPEVVERANVTRLVRRLGLPDYPSLVRWSQQHVTEFWDAVVDDLDVPFAPPYRTTLDLSDGIAWPRWFADGAISVGEACVRRHARRDPERLALVAEDEDGHVERLTYRELDRRAGAAAAGLASLGVGPGDAVGLYLPLATDAIVGLYACAYLGALAVPMFSGFNVTAVRDRLRDAGCRVLLTAVAGQRRGRAVPMLAVAREATAGLDVTLVARRGDDDLPAGVLAWEATLEGAAPAAPASVPPETPLLLVSTSGTTGAPKGVVHVHGGFLVKAGAEVAYHLDVQAGDVVHWLTDLGWIVGPWHVLGSHLAGATVVLYAGAPDYPQPDRLWALLERHRVTVAGVSPTLVRAMAGHGEEAVRRHDLSALRTLGSTGEAWDDNAFRWLFDVVGAGRCPIINVSGGTEVGACFVGGSPVLPLKVGSVGLPSPGMAIAVFGPDGAPVAPGETGELVCTQPWPSQTRGFHGAPERYLETYWSRWPGVWTHGDWASVDADGFWYLHGRSDDTLKVAGKRLGPSEVEAAALTSSLVAECVAVGMPDPVKGEVVWCLCRPASADVDEAELVAAVRGAVAAALGKAFAPARVVAVADLPRTRSGKLVRRLMRDRLLGRPLGDASAVANPDALELLEAVGS